MICLWRCFLNHIQSNVIDLLSGKSSLVTYYLWVIMQPKDCFITCFTVHCYFMLLYAFQSYIYGIIFISLHCHILFYYHSAWFAISFVECKWWFSTWIDKRHSLGIYRFMHILYLLHVYYPLQLQQHLVFCSCIRCICKYAICKLG